MTPCPPPPAARWSSATRQAVQRGALFLRHINWGRLERAMASVSPFLTKKLKLNQTKSAVTCPQEQKLLRFIILKEGSGAAHQGHQI